MATVSKTGLVTIVAVGKSDITATSTADKTKSATVAFTVNVAGTALTATDVTLSNTTVYAIVGTRTNNLPSLTLNNGVTAIFTIAPTDQTKDVGGVSIGATGALSITTKKLGKAEYTITASGTGTYARSSVTKTITVFSKYVITAADLEGFGVRADGAIRERTMSTEFAGANVGTLLTASGAGSPNDDNNSALTFTEPVIEHAYGNDPVVDVITVDKNTGTIEIGSPGEGDVILYLVTLHANKIVNDESVQYTQRILNASNSESVPEAGSSVWTTTGTDSTYKAQRSNWPSTPGKITQLPNFTIEDNRHLVTAFTQPGAFTATFSKIEIFPEGYIHPSGVTSVIIKQDSTPLNPNSSMPPLLLGSPPMPLTAEVKVEKGAATSVNWRSSNPAVATVAVTGSATGLVTIVGVGAVDIIATSTSDSGQSTTLALTVAVPPALTAADITFTGGGTTVFATAGTEVTTGLPSVTLNNGVTADFTIDPIDPIDPTDATKDVGGVTYDNDAGLVSITTEKLGIASYTISATGTGNYTGTIPVVGTFIVSSRYVITAADLAGFTNDELIDLGGNNFYNGEDAGMLITQMLAPSPTNKAELITFVEPLKEYAYRNNPANPETVDKADGRITIGTRNELGLIVYMVVLNKDYIVNDENVRYTHQVLSGLTSQTAINVGANVWTTTGANSTYKAQSTFWGTTQATRTLAPDFNIEDGRHLVTGFNAPSDQITSFTGIQIFPVGHVHPQVGIVTGVTIDGAVAEIRDVRAGDVVQLSATVEVEGTPAPDATILWTSTSGWPTGGTVSDSGLVRIGETVGAVTITAESNADPTKQARVTFNISPAQNPAPAPPRVPLELRHDPNTYLTKGYSEVGPIPDYDPNKTYTLTVERAYAGGKSVTGAIKYRFSTQVPSHEFIAFQTIGSFFKMVRLDLDIIAGNVVARAYGAKKRNSADENISLFEDGGQTEDPVLFLDNYNSGEAIDLAEAADEDEIGIRGLRVTVTEN